MKVTCEGHSHNNRLKREVFDQNEGSLGSMIRLVPREIGWAEQGSE